ncbi:MAG TPA: RecX family transcriptional regulator [Ideonella sp.]|nr:RecX family transcriptional regulator [Ideonella sp.]
MKRPLLSLKGQALALLSRREHSRAELRGKLLAHARKRALAAAEALRSQASAGAGAGAGAGDDFELAFLRPAAAPAAAPVFDDHEAPDPSGEIDAVLDWLEAQKYLSDSRFAESRVNARAGRHGQARIKQELARLGVTLDAETAQQLRNTEFERAREVWRRKFGELAADAAGRAKQARFLASRGFAAEVVWRVVGGREQD